MKYLCAALLCLSSVAWAEPVKVWQKDVPFAPFQNDTVKLLSVIELSAQDENFGGISGLLHKDDTLIGVTDRGYILRFQNTTLDQVDIFPLRNKKGKQLKGKKKTDAESLALSADGKILISFERNHRIVPYNEKGEIVGPQVALPKEIADFSDNNGLEAIETLSDGRLVLLSEGRQDSAIGFMWVQDAQGWKTFEIPLSDGYRPTGLARIPGEDRLVLLERFYEPISGVRARLSFLNADNGQRTQPFAQLGPPTPLDNFEAIAIKGDTDGQLIITLLSDDNFSILQRTLMMQLLLKQKP